MRLVLLPASVTRRGKPVRGLTQDAFTINEEGRPREIEVFATETDVPVSLAILLDLSGSMALGDKLGRAVRAIGEIVDGLGPDDRVGLIGFADRRVDWINDFTTDHATFLRRLAVQEAYGPTAIWDALAAAPGLVEGERPGRKAIVLVTDGLDNSSRMPMLEAVWLARRVNVPIYTLAYIPLNPKVLPRRGRLSLQFLERFSEETGGGLFPIYRRKDLERSVERIGRELRYQYVLGFHPDPGVRDGRFRQVRVDVEGRDLTVRTRRGYYARP